MTTKKKSRRVPKVAIRTQNYMLVGHVPSPEEVAVRLKVQNHIDSSIRAAYKAGFYLHIETKWAPLQAYIDSKAG